MAKVALSKTALQKERDSLQLYRRVLPSLDLKRLQLMGELARAKSQAVEARERVQRVSDLVAETLPMLANREMNLSNLVTVESVNVTNENAAGVELPKLESVDVSVAPYSLMCTPPWVDAVIDQLKRMLHLNAAVRIFDARVTVLNRAVRKVTQRINLFEKILIPRAIENIKRIKIFLSDMERSSIVRSKLAKAKRIRETEVLRQEEAS
ncbi:MAG: V-type ATP synthase subunit D [Myxococcota bacterium]|nr:V-type ATP synthase subunit D [Myxococcota bacterium]